MREIPQRSVWAQSLWISRKGVVWKRVFNAITKRWTWTEKAPLIFDQEGTRQGLNIPHFVPLDLLIARAWRMRKPGTATKVYLRDGVQPTAKTLRWQEEDGAAKNIDTLLQKIVHEDFGIRTSQAATASLNSTQITQSPTLQHQHAPCHMPPAGSGSLDHRGSAHATTNGAALARVVPHALTGSGCASLSLARLRSPPAQVQGLA